MLQHLKPFVNTLEVNGFLQRGHTRFFMEQIVGRRRNERRLFSDEQHLLAAAEWLERAQSTTGDGGVSGRYRLDSGWTSSYPETTGYIVPTFLRLANELGLTRFSRSGSARNRVSPDASTARRRVSRNGGRDALSVPGGPIAWMNIRNATGHALASRLIAEFNEVDRTTTRH